MSFIHQSALTDFGVMSLIIIFAHLLRYKVKFLQNTYMPSAVIAGLLGLVFGKQYFDIIPFSLNETGMPSIGSYPAYLVVLIFATLFMGKRKKKLSIKATIEHAGDTFFFNLASLFGQYGFGLLFGCLILAPLFPSLPAGFSVLLPAGFIGGHGTAGAMGGYFEQNGWDGALTVGYTMATVGILAGVLGGMVIINIATRKGWTRIVKSVQDMPESMRTGFVPEDQQQPSLGYATVSPIAIDPLTWHIALVIGVATIAIYVSDLLSENISSLSAVPTFCVALLVGALVQKIFELFKIGRYICRQTIHRIGSWITDYFVAFGIASIQIDVILDYAAPMGLLFAYGMIWTVGFMWFVGRKICRNFWFERSIFMYGWNTGSVATSVTLLRVIDPDARSQIMEDFGLAYILIAVFEIVIIATLPALIISGWVMTPALILISLFVIAILLSRYIVGWFPIAPDKLREGEADILDAEDVDL